MRPPLISPVTTRAGRKRKLQGEGEEKKVEPGSEHGLLNVGVVTGWFAEALHDFLTVK